MAHNRAAPAVRPHDVKVGPAMKPVLLGPRPHRLRRDLLDLDAPLLLIDLPHSLLFVGEFLRVAREEHGLQEKPGVFRYLGFVAKPLCHGPVVLPAIGEMDIISNLTLDELEHALLDVFKLIAPEGIAIIVQPFPFSLNGAKANSTDDPQRPCRKSKEAEEIWQVNPFLKRSEVCALVGQGAKTHDRAARQDHLQTDYQVGYPAVARHAVADPSFGDHGADDNRRSVSSVVGQHQSVLPQSVVNGVNTGSSFSDDVLE